MSLSELLDFANSDDGKAKYPKLKRALLSLDEMIGMKTVKESVASEIKTVLAYDILDKPQRSSPVQTRSRSLSENKGPKKRKKKEWSKKKKKKARTDDKTNMLVKKDDEYEDEDEEEIPKNIADFLKQINGVDDSDYESDEEEESIRTKRMRDLKLHTLVLGPPGTGKTTLAKKLAGIWEAIGLCNDKFVAITKGHLASKWQGQALETIRGLIAEFSNGVIFIDEAYSLVTDAKDSYGNEILSYIVHAMTDPTCTTTFIMAGYADMVKSQLFGANEGLSRRFNSIFVIEKPAPREMAKIFKIICNKAKGWKCIAQEDGLTVLFEQSKEHFKDSGGDVESLVLSSYKAHVNRFFPTRMSQQVSIIDVSEGLKMFKKNKSKKKVSAPEHLYM